MPTLERSIEVDVPASTAYNVWTQFERFPEFMEDVEEVEQLSPRFLRWRAHVWGKVEDWGSEITEQIPDKRIAWRSDGGASNSGVVTFHRLSGERSRVMLQMAYQPERWSERIGDALGVFTRRIEADLEAFKTFVEREGDHIEGWRGKVEALDDGGQREKAQRQRERAQRQREKAQQDKAQHEKRVVDPDPSAHFR